MTWVKLDDQFLTHPKVMAAGKDGRALFIAGLCYAAQHLTDGHIPAAVLPLLAAASDVRGKPAATRLVDVGLWEQAADGWVIHGFLEHNPSGAEVRAQREREREKKRRRRRGDDGRYTGGESRHVSPRESPGDTDRDTGGESPGESDQPVPVPVPHSTTTGGQHPSPVRHTTGTPATLTNPAGYVHATRQPPTGARQPDRGPHLCPTCNGTRHTLNPDNNATPCPDCTRDAP